MGTPKARDVLALAQQMVEAEAKLQSLKERWEALFSGEMRIAKPAREKATVGDRPLLQNGFPALALGVVESRPDEILTIRQVASLLGKDELETGKVLYRLAKGGKIGNPSRGRYQSLSFQGVPSEGIETGVASEEGTP